MNLPQYNQRPILPKSSTIATGKQQCDLSGKIRSRLTALALVAIALGLVLGTAKVGCAQQADYTDLSSIRAEKFNDNFGASVDFEATVTYVNEGREFIFVQKHDDAIFIHQPEVGHVKPGHQVRVVGRLSKGDLLPIISDPVVTVIGEGVLPTAPIISDIGLEHDCQYLTFEIEVLQTRVGITDTLLSSRTAAGKEFLVQIQHNDSVAFPSIAELAGCRVQCTGVLGVQIAGGAFRKPGKLENEIIGYKLHSNSFDDLKIITSKETPADAASKQIVGLSFLEKSSFADGPFLTFAQICLVEDAEQPSIVVCDSDSSLRINLQMKSDLHPGQLVRIGGQKTTNATGQPQFQANYVRDLGMAELLQPDPVSIVQAIETFKPNQRIAVIGQPLRIEDRNGRPHLILKDGASTIAVNFLNDSIDTFSSLDPTIAKKVKITGVTREDQHHGFQLDVVRASDVQLIERKTSLSRIFAIGFGTLMLICSLSAIWIKLLKDQVDQQQRFEAIFDHAGCPITVFNGNLQIINANQVAADMTGYSKEELRKMSVPDLDKQATVMQIKDMLLKTMNLDEVGIFPTKVQTRDKQLLDVEVRCRNLTASDNPEKATYIAVFPDVTDRNRHESELKEARDEAIKANNAKSEFVAAMSHELRTPINGVLGMTQLLENTDLTPTQADYLAACRSSGETLLTVIGDVLDFSKMEAGKLELEPQPTKLIPFIENIVRATSLQQGTRHVDLASFIDPQLSRSVMVDGNRLRQVIFNLLGNAAKFTAKGSITVAVNCTNVTDQHADVQFVFSDTGIGIPKDRIAGLFEAFEQFDSSTTREFGGTGLGLTICKQIVQLMGGKIYAKSEVNKGSDFVIEVQLPFATQEDNGTDGDQDYAATDKRVAVVGMDAPIAKILRKMFDAHQVEASFHRETDILLEDEIDVVLLNNKGDVNAVRNFIDTQRAWSTEKAPLVIPVVPACCTIDFGQWKRKGIAKPIFKPFTQSCFLRPIDSRERSSELKQAGRISPTTLSDHDLRVLICEDNSVNQMFATEVCRIAGIQAVVRENGRLGIETLEIDDNFDVIFMDCNMPVMDGFQAAKEIRKMTESGAIRKIPVIALTANALAGDRENCLEAGMEDFLTKPYEIEDFLEKVHLHTNKTAPNTLANDPLTPPDKSVFNFEKLLDQFDDREFVLSLAEQFAASLPQFRADLQGCLDQQDTKQALHVAHRLKGTSGTVQADRINAIAVEIESAGRAGQFEQLESQIAEVLLEFENFVNELGNQPQQEQATSTESTIS